ncbi:hypothetical protein ACFLT7_06465 [candidate division KSB1 bacterium]
MNKKQTRRKSEHFIEYCRLIAKALCLNLDYRKEFKDLLAAQPIFIGPRFVGGAIGSIGAITPEWFKFLKKWRLNLPIDPDLIEETNDGFIVRAIRASGVVLLKPNHELRDENIVKVSTNPSSSVFIIDASYSNDLIIPTIKTHLSQIREERNISMRPKKVVLDKWPVYLEIYRLVTYEKLTFRAIADLLGDLRGPYPKYEAMSETEVRRYYLKGQELVEEGYKKYSMSI